MNKMMRMAMMVSILFVAASTTVNAQEPGRKGGGGRGNQKAMLLKDIKIDEATDAKIDSVLAKYQQQQRAMFQEARASGGQPDMAKVEDLMKKRNEEIRALLKEEDRKTFEKNAEEAAAARGRRGPPGLV